MERGCGLFMPISSLPNKYGFGIFSKEVYDFIDFLSSINIKYWQILPLSEMSNIKSSVCHCSSFALDPLYIDAEKYMAKEEIEFFKLDSANNFEEFKEKKLEMLKYLFDKLYFETNLDKYIEDNKSWIYDYAVFKVLQDELNLDYCEFLDCYKNIDSGETISFIKTHNEEIVYYIFLQYVLNRQWMEIKKYAFGKGIKIISSASIFSDKNSADVYSSKNNFLFKNNNPIDFIEYYGYEREYEKSKESVENSSIFNNYGIKNENGIAIFDYEFNKKTNYIFLVEKFKHLMKLYDYVIIENANEIDRFFSNNENTKNGNSNQIIKNELLEELKNNKIKNIILEEFEYKNQASETNKFESDKLENQNFNYYVTKNMQLAFTNNLQKFDLSQNFDKKTIAYLETYKQNKFAEILEDEATKSRVCSYLNLPVFTENNIIVKMAIDNLLSSDANVCMLNMVDIENENYLNNFGGYYDFSLSKNYNNEKYFEYLKELIKNKNR